MQIGSPESSGERAHKLVLSFASIYLSLGDRDSHWLISFFRYLIQNCFYLQVILSLKDVSLGLQEHNLQALKRGQFWKNGNVGLSHILIVGRRPNWEVLAILSRYWPQSFLSKIWGMQKGPAPLLRSVSLAAEEEQAGKRGAQGYSKQVLLQGAASFWSLNPFLL